MFVQRFKMIMQYCDFIAQCISNYQNYYLMKHLLLLWVIIQVALSQVPRFCSSRCAGTTDSCFGPNPNECYACDPSIFDVTVQDQNCVLLPQQVILLDGLRNDNVDLNGFDTSKSTTFSCLEYHFAGKYVSGDYIERNIQ